MAPTTPDVAKEAMAAVEKLQTDVTATQERLNNIEVIADDMKTKITSMDAMIQSIYKAVMSTTTDSEPPSAAKVDNSALTNEELAFQKIQEAEGKIILHTEPPIFTGKSDPNASTLVLHEEPKGKKSVHIPTQAEFHSISAVALEMGTSTAHMWSHSSDHQFSLSIARPKLDFPNFNGDNPVG